MTEAEAARALALLRGGRSFRTGHYTAGYETLSWDPTLGAFLRLREDLGLDQTAPEVTRERLEACEAAAILESGWTFGQFQDGLL